jgi:ubiquitin-protein ligase
MALARRRLLRDLAEVQREPSELVSALPLESNLFEWHANLRPSSGPLAGVVLHVRITFPHNYPDAPPNLLFPMDKIPSFVHPNLYSFGLCLDILSSFIGRTDERAGWSPAYSVRTLLLQLQSFLFEFDAAPQDHGGHYSARARYDEKRIAKVRSEAARLSCSCGHCGQRSWPPLEGTTAPAPSPAEEEAMPATEAAVSLRRTQQLRLQAERALRSASELKCRTEGGLRAAGSAIQLVWAAGATQVAVRVVDVASSGHVCLGFAVMDTSSQSMSLCPQSVGWDSRGRLSFGRAVKVRKLALPPVSRGDVMEISVLEKAIEFRLNGK